MSINEYDDIISGEGRAEGNEYDSLLNDKVNEKQAIQGNMFAAKEADPARKANVLNLSKKLKMPSDFVDRNYDELSKQNKPTDYSDIVKSNPGLSQWMQKRENAELGKNDLEGLKKIDTRAQSFKPAVSDPVTLHKELFQASKGGFNQLGMSMLFVGAAYGKIDSATAVEHISEMAVRQKELRDASPDFVKRLGQVIEKEGGDVDKAWEKTLQGYDEYKRGNILNSLKAYSNIGATAYEVLDLAYETVVNNPRAAAYMTVENLSNSFPSLAAGIAGMAVGAATPIPFAGPVGMGVGTFAGSIFVEVGSSINEEFSERGIDMSDPDALTTALNNPEIMNEIKARAERKGITTAGFDAVFSTIGGAIFSKAGKGITKEASKLAGKAAVKSGAKEAARVAGHTLFESIGEGASEFAGQIAREEGDLSKASLGEAALEGILSVGQSAGTAVGAKAVSAAAEQKKKKGAEKKDKARKKYHEDPVEATQEVAEDTAQANKTKAYNEAMNEVFDEVENLENVKDVPDKVGELVDYASGGDEKATMYMQTDDFDSFWNKKGKNPTEVAEKLLGDSSAYKDSKAAGTDLEIPISKFFEAATIDPEIREMIDQTKPTVNGMTLKEAESHLKDVEGLIETLAEEAVVNEELVASDQVAVYEAEAKDIGKDVTEQLVKVGKKSRDAKIQGSLYESTFNAIAQRTGQSPKELYAQYGLKIGTGEQTVSDGDQVVLDQIDKEVLEVLEAEAGPKTPVAKKIKPKKIIKQDDKGRLSFGENRQMNIDLLKNADPSTFLHETGHLFLEILGDLAEADGAPQQIMDDHQGVLDWLGVKDRSEIKTEHHEKWARGFEAYLMEGKAPSLRLRKAFHTFKVWLTSVYRELKNLNVELTPEVRNVMNRLVATEDEIARANEEYDIAPMFGTDPSAFGFTGKKAERYLKTMAEAKVAAEEQMLAEVMDGYSREKMKWWKSKRKSLREEVEAETNEMPLYKALANLQRGKLPDGTILEDPIKLDRKSLVEAYGAEFVKNTLPKPYMYAREGGLHHDVVADMYGFESGNAMINQLVNMPPKKAFVDAQTDQKMQQLYPDLLADDEKLEAAALKSIHNEQRSKLLRLEMEMLLALDPTLAKEVIRKTIRRLPPDTFIKRQAETILGRKQVRHIRPHLFLNAEKKASQEAAALLTKGDFDNAYLMKERELLNQELYKAAIKAKEDIKKKQGKFKKMFRKDADLAKSRDMDLVNAARAVLAEYGLGRTEKTALEYLDNIRQFDPTVYETIKSLVDSATEKAGPYKEITLNQFNEMNETVEALWNLSKESKEIEIDGKKISLEEAREDLIAQMAVFNKDGGRKKYDEDADKWDKTKSKILSTKAMLRRFEHWVTSMDLKDIDGAFRKYLFNNVSERSDEAAILSKDIKTKIDVEAEKIRPGMTFDKIEAPELGFRFANKAELLGAVQHIGNLSNKKKLLVGRGWGSVNEDGSLNSVRWDKFLDRMFKEGVVTKADMDFVQFLWDTNESLKPMAQRSHKKIFGYYFDSITHEVFDTPFGEYRGGYMPAKIDTTPPKQGPSRAYSIADRQKIEQMASQFNMNTMPYSGGSGFGKSRVEGFNMPLILDIGLAGRHIDEVIRFSLIKPAVMDASKIILTDDFRHAIAQLDPSIIDELIVPALERADKQRINTLEGAGSNAVNNMANYFRKSASMQIMFMHMQNIVEQVTGFFPALVRVQPGSLMTALGQYASAPKEVAKNISDKSTFMKARMDDNLFEYNKRVSNLFEEKNKFQKVRDYAEDNAYIAQIMLQNHMDITIWQASYSEAIRGGKTETQATRTADRDVRETQGSARPLDISRAEGNPFMRIMQMFMGFFNNLANLNATEFRSIYYDDMGMKEKYARGFYVYFNAFAMVAIGSALVRKMAFGKLDDDDDGEYIDDAMEVIFGSQWRLLTAMVPLVGPAVEAGMNRFNDKHYDDRVSASPAFDAVSKVAGLPASITRLVTADEMKSRDIRDTMTGMGVLLGLPIGPASKPIIYLKEVEEGKARPSGPIDFVRGLTTGKPGS